MSDPVQKKCEQLETTKHTEENSIIQEKLPHRINGQAVRKYVKGKLLGKGGFARCFEATNIQTKKISAIKIVNKQNLKKSKAKQKLITEIKIHKTLKHHRVVSFDHVFEDSENVYILLELCSNNTLNDLLKKRKRLSQFQAQYFISQLTEGLAYIHNSKVIHRDLKLGNLMLTENMELKIGDFGLAAKLETVGERKKTICGTPNYIAPQILEGKGHSYEVDLWSMGAILYALLYGRPPFQTSDVKKTYKRIKQCQFSFVDEVQVSNNAKNLISKLLILDPSKRLSLDQIRTHPFLTENQIPDTLPTSIISSPLPRSYLDNYSKVGSGKRISEKHDGRLNSGMSDRLLLRTSSGFGRNYFAKTSTQKPMNPRLTTNNFFSSSSSLPQSNKKAKDVMMQGNYDMKFVKKWVDYSSKYGLGYLLSDRSTGIYFNDSSKIVLSNDYDEIDYVSSAGQLSSYSLESPPSDRELMKKITLMQYFKKYLNSGSPIENETQKKSSMFCYVKRWAKSEQGIIFRLSNKVLQINYVDKSQLVIYASKNVGVFSGPNHGSQKIFFELGGAETKHPLLAKKIQEMSIMIKLMAKPKPLPKEDREVCVIEDCI